MLDDDLSLGGTLERGPRLDDNLSLDGGYRPGRNQCPGRC